ncbi:LacI family DNA-binding transcriptional regulator [Kitasatospora sp. NPDC088346]|uniref:LacI family DNA-binding transcriptional regulator n=1 Tax=Kitasatospora sp. NPDC088346 TaxID=3364073 RepID=UPI003807115E
MTNRNHTNTDGPRRRRPTMVDVAREANVALRTVSRYVNNDPTVGIDLADRIRAAITAPDYAPDERAQQLRRGTTGIVGVTVRSIAGPNPLLGAVDQAARVHGLTVLAMATDDDDQRERAAVLSMCGRRVDGIIMEPTSDNHQYLATEIESGMSVVAVDRRNAGIDTDAVVSDNAAGVGMAFRHLVQHGHHRITYIGDQERVYTGSKRAAAFRACTAANGGAVDNMVHPGAVEPARIAAALAIVLGGDLPATALITGNQNTTIEVLRQLGSRTGVPAIVGFDDFPLADLLQPGLTAIAQDSRKIGRLAFDLLLPRIADPTRPTETVTLPVELIVRGSGEQPPPA